MLLTLDAEIQFSLPCNTAMVGGTVTRMVVVFRCDIAFAEWWRRSCETMGLDLGDAQLGYKYEGAPAGEPPTQIASEADLRIAISTGQAMTARALSRTPRVMVYNLVSVHYDKRNNSNNFSTVETCYAGSRCIYQAKETCTRRRRAGSDSHRCYTPLACS